MMQQLLLCSNRTFMELKLLKLVIAQGESEF